MGSIASKELEPTVNENFLKMSAFPNENILLATASIQSQDLFSKWASNLLKISHKETSPILLPQQFNIISRTPCGGQSILEIKYECYFVNFEDQIEGRKEKQNHFEEQELWYLLLTLVEAAQASYQLSSSLGDIKPSNLLLNNNGKIKVLTKLSKPQFSDSYEMQNPINSLYSPEELNNRKKGYKSNNASNYLLSQSFSIGMTMLAAGTLTTVSSIYNYQTNQLNLILLNKTLKYWEQFEFYSQVKKQKCVYSKKLKEIVMNLLKFEPQKRICSLQVNKILQNYENQIKTSKKFTVQDKYLKDKQAQTNLKTHRLQSRRKSQLKGSMRSSLAVPSFNNSHDVSFQLQFPNAFSELYNTSDKKNTSQFSSSSNKRKLSVTAYFQEKQQSK